ncbi:nucleoside hydrolase [Amylostereum chailletii]|nr:nucleoside hydrolase [Amylostereum chailletii]
MTQQTRTRTPVIIDTDPGVDDTVAILMAMASPEIEILAFVVTFGNTDLEASYANIFKIYQAIGREIEHDPSAAARFPNYTQKAKPIIVKGPRGPLSGDQHSAKYFHGRDGLGNAYEHHPDLNVPDSVLNSSEHPKLKPVSESAVDVALDLLRARAPREVTYIVLGPMTNLALMTRADPVCVRERIGRVVVMGGSLDVPGNVSSVAEFNWYADPYAAAELLTPDPSGLPHRGLPLSRVLILPLDITTAHELPFPVYTQHVDPTFSPDTPSSPSGKAPMRHFSSAFLRRTREIMKTFGKDALDLHDITAVWAAMMTPPVKDAADKVDLELPHGWQVTRRRFLIERTGEHTRGMCVVDRRNDHMAYAPGENRAAMQAALIKASEDAQREEFGSLTLESTVVPVPVEVETTPEPELQGEGIPIVTKTPGPDVLLGLLFERVWGVSLR